MISEKIAKEVKYIELFKILMFAIAGILGLWAAIYTFSKTRETSKLTTEIIDCNLLDFDVMLCRKEKELIKIVLFNKKSTDIENFILSFLDENSIPIKNIAITKTLKASSYETIEINFSMSNFSKIEIKSF